jgi:predicted ArsR family transcriptional regulator
MAGPGPASGRPQAGSATPKAILFALRRDGPLSPDDLVGRLGISRTAVLQQLRGLTSNGLVERRAVRHGVGRPRHLYEVTSAAQAAFPSSYDRLAEGLLQAIGSVGGRTMLDEVFRARRTLLTTSARQRLAAEGLADAPLAERVALLARIQDELGYLASTEIERAPDGSPTGVVRLRECNCAIHAIATEHPDACRCEISWFRDVLEARVVRETHIAAGARSCTYRIEELPAERRNGRALPVLEATPGRIA